MGRKQANRLAEAVYGKIKAEIFDFHLLPGDRFTETELAERYAVSRTPVRDALYRLKREGHVDVEFRAGWTVCPMDFDRFEELYDLRILLEATAIERLCQAEEPPRFPELRAIWQVPAGARETDPRAITELDEGFHRALVAAAGNRVMAAIHDELTEKIRIVRRLDFLKDYRIAATYEEHALILRLIQRRRAVEALMLLRAHITESKIEVRKITLHMLHEARAQMRPAAKKPKAPSRKPPKPRRERIPA
jgi:DNA-binding GntR family transcriptional regulator